MPYKRIDKTVYKYQDGKWVSVGKSDTVEKAIKHLKILRMIEHGYKVRK